MLDSNQVALQKVNLQNQIKKAELINQSIYHRQFENNYKLLVDKLWEIKNTSDLFTYEDRSTDSKKSVQLNIILGGKKRGSLIIQNDLESEIFKMIAHFDVGNQSYREEYVLEPNDKGLITAYRIVNNYELIESPTLADEHLIEYVVAEILNNILSHYS